MSKVMTRPMPLSNIPAPSLISFTFAYPADEWWSYSESYVVMETKAVRGMLENGRVDPNRVLNAEVLATGRAVDVTRKPTNRHGSPLRRAIVVSRGHYGGMMTMSSMVEDRVPAMTYAEYRAAVEGRAYAVSGSFGRSESAIARAIAVRLAHGYTVELPPAYDRLSAQREARLARVARGQRG